MFEDLKKGDRVLVKCGRIWFVQVVYEVSKDKLEYVNDMGHIRCYFSGQLDVVKLISEEQHLKITNHLLEMRERFEAEVLPLDPIKFFEK